MQNWLFFISAVIGANYLQTDKISVNKWMKVKALVLKTLQSSRYGAAKTHMNAL